jgi:hypothetical protein
LYSSKIKLAGGNKLSKKNKLGIVVVAIRLWRDNAIMQGTNFEATKLIES